MLHDLTKRLIDRVHALTLSDNIEWSAGPGASAYSFRADDYSVAIEIEGAATNLMIADAEGRELETVTGEDLASANNAQGKDYESVVREVFARARRAALGTDVAIERILEAIDTDVRTESDARRQRPWGAG